MRPAYIDDGMTAPVQFFRRHIRENKQCVTVRYSDSSWTVKLRSYGHNRGQSFLAGWHAFARETLLHVENVCVFTLIDSDDVVCRVYKFTSARNAKEVHEKIG